MLFLKIKSQLLIFMKETTSISFVQTLRVSLILIPPNPTTDSSKQYKQQYVLMRNLTIHMQTACICGFLLRTQATNYENFTPEKLEESFRLHRTYHTV